VVANGADSGSTRRRAAVLGSPIQHSLSPTLHRAAYAALGLTGWRYEAFDCDEAGLPTFVERLGPEWAGLSLTMPLKRVALTVVDEISPLASAVGAANTLVLGQPGDPRRAENTDVTGILAALREAGVDQVSAAVILGAGGTAQARARRTARAWGAHADRSRAGSGENGGPQRGSRPARCPANDLRRATRRGAA
jgi:shikimate dehydrogenase